MLIGESCPQERQKLVLSQTVHELANRGGKDLYPSSQYTYAYYVSSKLSHARPFN